MESLKQASYVLRTLKKEGFDAYFVGGCVRDYLLKKDTMDIDITTNANPSKIMKLFNAKPTGLNYGTVSVKKGAVNIEITTYRQDGKYTDNRHPDEVLPVDTVEDDVKRRDFTINGLVMDLQYQIFDYVGGKEDLRLKFIKAIGNPNERFQEDALRMLRAAYFQAKLGFQIEKETRVAIFENRALLKNLPMERVLTELIKLLKEPFQLNALKTLETSQLADYLPGLKNGISYLNQTQKEPIFTDSFFTVCFALNGSVPKEWKFSNLHRNKYETVVNLVNTKQPLSDIDLYTHGLEICLLTNKTSFILGYSPNQKRLLEDRFAKLPIKSVVDLKLRGPELLEITGKKPGAWLSKALDDLVKAVLNKQVDNNYEALKAYVIERGI